MALTEKNSCETSYGSLDSVFLMQSQMDNVVAFRHPLHVSHTKAIASCLLNENKYSSESCKLHATGMSSRKWELQH